jgi:hypothetical protein
MKVSLWILMSLFFGPLSSALECPDISGIYGVYDSYGRGHVIRIDQQACAGISLSKLFQDADVAVSLQPASDNPKWTTPFLRDIRQVGLYTESSIELRAMPSKSFNSLEASDLLSCKYQLKESKLERRCMVTGFDGAKVGSWDHIFFRVDGIQQAAIIAKSYVQLSPLKTEDLMWGEFGVNKRLNRPRIMDNPRPNTCDDQAVDVALRESLFLEFTKAVRKYVPTKDAYASQFWGTILPGTVKTRIQARTVIDGEPYTNLAVVAMDNSAKMYKIVSVVGGGKPQDGMLLRSPRMVDHNNGYIYCCVGSWTAEDIKAHRRNVSWYIVDSKTNQRVEIEHMSIGAMSSAACVL